MALRADVSINGNGATLVTTETLDLGALPQALAAQCQSLIESYHEIHGYACLPNMLWRAQFGDFINKHPHLRQILRKASRSFATFPMAGTE